MTHYLDAAVEAAQAAGELLRHNFQQPLRINSAEAHDIKLEIDVRAQELISGLLLKKFPEHALYGEEGIVGDQASDHQWVVDPLDGTVNYFYGIPHFCFSIALRYMGEIIVGVIHDPIRDEMWTAQKGGTPMLNGKAFRVSERADLAEAVISVGLSKTGVTIDSGMPLLQHLQPRFGQPDHRAPPDPQHLGRLVGEHLQLLGLALGGRDVVLEVRRLVHPQLGRRVVEQHLDQGFGG